MPAKKRREHGAMSGFGPLARILINNLAQIGRGLLLVSETAAKLVRFAVITPFRDARQLTFEKSDNGLHRSPSGQRVHIFSSSSDGAADAADGTESAEVLMTILMSRELSC